VQFHLYFLPLKQHIYKWNETEVTDVYKIVKSVTGKYPVYSFEVTLYPSNTLNSNITLVFIE
jgi:hypothetical protein